MTGVPVASPPPLISDQFRGAEVFDIWRHSSGLSCSSCWVAPMERQPRGVEPILRACQGRPSTAEPRSSTAERLEAAD